MSIQAYNSVVNGGTTATVVPPKTQEQQNHESQKVIDTQRVTQKSDVERIYQNKQDGNKLGTSIDTYA